MELIEYKEMREAIQQIRELHKPVQGIMGNDVCEICTEQYETEWEIGYIQIGYPCPTIKALGGK